MPSPPNSYALISLWKSDGAPWKWPTWQKLTGIEHGLFPENDALLPSGITRKDVAEIKSYFERFLAESEDKRLKLHNEKAGVVPGRDKWKKWFAAASRQWNLHSLVVDAFNENNINPNQVFRVSGLDEWPDARSYITTAFDSLGITLFGEESLDELGHLSNPLRQPIHVIAQTSWNLMRVQHARAQKKLSGAEHTALAAFQEASTGEPTRATFSNAIKAIAKWRNLSEIVGNSKDLSKIDEKLEELQALMASVGAVIDEAQTKARNGNAPRLASEADLDYLVRLYQDLIDVTDEDSPPLQVEPQLDVVFAALEGDGSLGVEREMAMSPDQLADELGFTNRLPFLFNQYRHKTGFVVWNKPTLFNNPDSNPDLVPLRLHWHQLAGLHALLRQIFSSEPGKIPNAGVLIADDVGLGKTGMAISMIAFLIHVINLTSLDRPPPKVIRKRPFFGDEDVLPDLPHLIIVPGTLLAQWVTELQTFFQKHVVDILVYPKKRAQRAAFWAPNGPFETSKHDISQRIIIASQSALLQDYSASFKSGKAAGRKLPWDLPSLKPEARTQDTLYGKRYLCSVFDEAHMLRNIGAKHFSALRIRELSSITLALTATPVQTKTGDAASMGRLIGVPYFLSPEAHDDEKGDAAALRKAKKEASQMDDDGLPSDNSLIRCTHVNASLRMQKQFEGHIIRRTTQSVDWRGKNLLDLPPIKRIKAVVKLTDREMSIINKLSESAKENVSAANAAGKFLTDKFYVDYRMACAFAFEGSPPKILSFKDWNACISTKMDTTARIIQHHLQRDDAAQVTFENGKAAIPPLPPSPIFTRTMKIVVFQLFPSLREPLSQCLTLYGIDCMAIDGAKSYDVRATIVAAFEESTSCRVLIISSVGSAGLNLAFCNCVIYLDQPWSSQDERQIDGRVWRQPQDKEVLIYHILADQTSDILLSGMASTKRDMLEAFLDKNTGEELMQLLSGKTIQEDDGDEDSHGDLTVSKRKSTASLNSTQSNDGVEEKPKKGKGKHRKAKGERKKVSKSPLVVGPTPGPSPSEPGVGDTSGEEPVSEDGGRVSDAFTSENEGSAMDFDLDKLDIEDDSQDMRPRTPPHHQYVLKRNWQPSPPTAQPAGDVSTSRVRNGEGPAKVVRTGQFDDFSAQRARSQGSEVVSKRVLPTGGSQNLDPSRRNLAFEAPSTPASNVVHGEMQPGRASYQQMDVDMELSSSQSAAGRSSARSSITPTARLVPNASLMTPPAQPFGAPSANRELLRGAAPIGGKNPLKAPPKAPRGLSKFQYHIGPESSSQGGGRS